MRSGSISNISKSDLIEIIKWKFQGRLLGRQKRILKLLENVDDSIIERTSKLTFKCKDDETKLKLFS